MASETVPSVRVTLTYDEAEALCRAPYGGYRFAKDALVTGQAKLDAALRTHEDYVPPLERAAAGRLALVIRSL